MSDPDSGDLLLAAAGDGVAFQRLLERWRQPIFSFFHRAKETSAASEAAVETFVRLYRTAEQYPPATPFPVWLYGIASRLLQEELPQPVPSIPAQRLHDSPAARLALVRGALAALPTGERAAFLLTRAAGLSVPMTGLVLGVPEVEVAKRLVRAMEGLRKTLDPLLEAGPRTPSSVDRTAVLDQGEEPGGEMTNDEFLRRLVDPGSAAHGGHGPLVDHLNSNPDARATARAFGAIERLYSSEPGGSIPTDFDNRVLARLAADTPASTLPAGRASTPLVAGAALVVAVGVLLLLRGQKTPPPPPAATESTPVRAAAATTSEVADIERVQSTPLSLDGPPLTEEESKRALALHDAGFLRLVETLAGLDPFFPENTVVTGLQGPPSQAPPPPEPTVLAPDSEQQYNRLLDWRRTPRAERERVEALDAAFRARPADQQDVLLRRWELVSILSPEELAGLRRLVGRLADLEPGRRDRLTYEIRQLGLESDAEKREERWRALPFARNLTGQELTAADKLLRWK